MKTKHIFSLAALALTMVACSSDDTTQSQPSLSGQKIPFSAVINTDAAGTRALTEAEDGKSITAEWKADEQVALIHGKTVEILGVESVDATSGSATIKGYLTTAPTDGEAVHVVYVGETNSVMADLKEKLEALGTDITKDNITAQASASIGSAQDGTLEAISQKLDYRYAEANFAVSEGVATFASSPKLVSQFSIWKLKLSDGTNDLKASKLVMKKGTTAHVTIDLGTSSTKSEFYMAFIPEGNSYTFEATVGESTYTCTPTISTAPASGKFYSSTLTMASATANTYRVYTSGTAYDDVAIPTDATTVTSSTTTWAAGTYVVSSDVTIASDVTLTGDVNLILSDGAELTVNGCIFGGADYDHGFVYKLNIYGQSSGTGKLTIDYSGSHSLGVVTASELNIHGGEITVKGSAVMQGLEPADLNVYNGTVNATGKANGIIAMGNTHIYGGTVIANSTTNYGAALLSGNDGKTMTISGGVVKATNSGGSAGIETTSNNNLVITGGTVIAQGGNQMEGINSYGTITISGGTVTAKGGAGGGIGLEGKATISGGTVEAIGGDGVADGNKNGASGFDGTLTVTGGTLTATGGAGYGDGSDGLGLSGNVTLGSGISLFAGTSPSPTESVETGPKSDVLPPEVRYLIIKPAE